MKVERQSKEKLEEVIIEEKLKGIPDHEIGRKYGISFKLLEKIITKTQGLSVSSFKFHKKIKTLHPKDFKEETTTIWSFPQRGNWATHSGEYRGNWSPYIPRNLILKYSEPGDLVLDYFCGAGTTSGYSLEYILFALKWILEQEDINFKSGSEKKQKELDEICKKQNITTPEGRLGSQLAIALLCDIANDTHPVEALLKANLDIRPKGKK
ncbi:MAG: site-specific DNA-methyltransferase [Thermodesulfovibrio sp.]|nr:site-specific DNA-methyltransferase [Thermodesulfovibrio sp.]